MPRPLVGHLLDLISPHSPPDPIIIAMSSSDPSKTSSSSSSSSVFPTEPTETVTTATTTTTTTTTTSLPKNPYPFPDPNADMQPTNGNPISGLPFGIAGDHLSVEEMRALPEEERKALAKRRGITCWDPYTVMAIYRPANAGAPIPSHEEMRRQAEEAVPLPDDDDEQEEDEEEEKGV
ncbi:hypothetical protein K504DRAFT_486714 [Pleomassaria siparia CBS 279.74]|uniref:Uncharacterized protein n=1 Tax=Pleomassaria siparia CBS 279.74 TaxID=1314801 RepID=A0A6G1KR20_9PLEO|nr:hypothetical protein K504DRAFT_486714 [Pleomassaria siparia CBS 279.74]